MFINSKSSKITTKTIKNQQFKKSNNYFMRPQILKSEIGLQLKLKNIKNYIFKNSENHTTTIILYFRGLNFK